MSLFACLSFFIKDTEALAGVYDLVNQGQRGIKFEFIEQPITKLISKKSIRTPKASYMKNCCYTLSYPWTKSFAIHALRMRVPCGVFST